MERFKRLRPHIYRIVLFLFALSNVTQANSWDLELGGSLKSFLTFQRLKQNGIFQHNDIPALEQRLRLQGALNYRWLRAEFANETFFYYRRSNASLFPVPDFTPQSAWQAQWTLENSLSTELINRFDRAFVQFDWDAFKFVVGKQVIPLGVGQIFNAVSQIQRYPLIFVDPEFPKTEDAATFIWTGPFQLEARFLPKSGKQRQDNFHLRVKGTKAEVDLGLTAGISDDKSFLGTESAFNVGEALLRLEVVGYAAQKRHFGQGLVGLDYVFSSDWSSKWELFYNGFGEVSQSLFSGLFHRSAPFQGTWYAGNVLVWEAHPLLKAHLISVVNLKDPSALFHFFLNYSLSNSVDLLAGQFVGLGRRNAEFGGQFFLSPTLSLGQSDISYAALRWYF